MKASLILLGLAFGTNAMAGHRGDVSCESSWKICLQSVALDSANTIHYVTTLNLEGKNINIPDSSKLQIVNSTGDVQINNITVGKIGEDVGTDANTALSRELIPNTNIHFNMTSSNGTPVTFCNQTALGVIYERYTYKTINQKLVINEDQKVIAEINSVERVEPAISVHTSIIPCKK